MWAWVGLLAAMTAQTGPETPTEPVGVVPVLPVFPAPGPAIPRVGETIVRLSTPVRGLGPRLAARIRTEGPLSPQRFIAHSLDEEAVRMSGGQVDARLGPLVAGTLAGQDLLRLAPTARYMDAPASLRPALDIARDAVEGQRPDQGDGFDQKYRGDGVLIAAYDTGIDLRHPDLRELDGPTRVYAIWDQEREGTPPPESSVGHVCRRESLLTDNCPHRDTAGHGTVVTSLAASGAPQYRGIAPNADLIIAASRRFDLFLPTLAWFRRLAADIGQPMVVNISLAGQEGPHDGTSLEAQAINELGHLVVVAAGNEGQTSVHAAANLLPQEPRQVSLRFPSLSEPRDRRAVVDVWADDGTPLVVRFRLISPEGNVVEETGTISVGDPGRTEMLGTATATLAVVQLDPEATVNPFNQRQHIRIELLLPAWTNQQNPIIEVQGQGRVDLWVDTPPQEEGLVRFDDAFVEGIQAQLVGDTELTISDISTAAAAVSVAAFVSRTSFTTDENVRRSVEGTLGVIAGFTSRGPSTPGPVGQKPDLAAPGSLVIGASSRDAPVSDFGRVSDLYRVAEGTSMATPIVTGAAAVLLGARPELGPRELKQFLLRGARAPPDSDPRWGAGRLDVTRSLELTLNVDSSGCQCLTSPGHPPGGAPMLLWCLIFVWMVGRRARL